MITRNNIGLLLGVTSGLLGTFLIFIISSWSFEKNELDVFVYLFSLATIFNVISDFGLRGVAYIDIRKSEDKSELFIFQSFYKMIFWLITSFLFILYSYLSLRNVTDLVLVFSIYTGLIYASDINVQYLRGIDRSDRELVLNLLEKIVLATSLIASFMFNLSPVYFASSIILAGMSRYLVGFIYCSSLVSWDEFDRCKPRLIKNTCIMFFGGLRIGLGTILQIISLRWMILLLPFTLYMSFASQIAILTSIIQAFLFIPTFISVKYFSHNGDKCFSHYLLATFFGGMFLSFLLFVLFGMINNVFNNIFENYYSFYCIIILSCPAVLITQLLRHYFIGNRIAVVSYNIVQLFLVLFGVIVVVYISSSFIDLIYMILLIDYLLMFSGLILYFLSKKGGTNCVNSSR